MYLLFLGSPGAGKGTHARKLSEDYEAMFHLSSGALLRKAARRKTSGGQVIKRYIVRGRLVPDEITVKLVKKEIMKFRQKEIIFDGFPRTPDQAQKLDTILNNINKELSLVLFLDVDKESLIYRLKGRRICSNDGSIYHVEVNPPEKEGKCDICGANLFHPRGDREEIVKKKVVASKKRNQKLISYYKNRVEIEKISGTDRPPEVVYQDIRDIVEYYKN